MLPDGLDQSGERDRADSRCLERMTPRVGAERDGREVVNLVGALVGDRRRDALDVGDVGLDERDALPYRCQIRELGGRIAPDEADDVVPLRHEELAHVRAVLTGGPDHESAAASLHPLCPGLRRRSRATPRPCWWIRSGVAETRTLPGQTRRRSGP